MPLLLLRDIIIIMYSGLKKNMNLIRSSPRTSTKLARGPDKMLMISTGAGTIGAAYHITIIGTLYCLAPGLVIMLL